MARNPLIRPRSRPKGQVMPHQSAGILDDFAVRKTIASLQGTIDHTPTNAKDIVNKEFMTGANLGDDIFVLNTGDTMTGTLTISGASGLTLSGSGSINIGSGILQFSTEDGQIKWSGGASSFSIQELDQV